MPKGRAEFNAAKPYQFKWLRAKIVAASFEYMVA